MSGARSAQKEESPKEEEVQTGELLPNQSRLIQRGVYGRESQLLIEILGEAAVIIKSQQ